MIHISNIQQPDQCNAINVSSPVRQHKKGTSRSKIRKVKGEIYAQIC
jgi:hypothetical protein